MSSARRSSASVTRALSAVVLIAGAAPLAAQSAENVLTPLVPKSSMVRLRMQGTEMTGRLIALTSGVATLSTESGNRTASLAALDSIWVQGRATKTGAIVGGIAGLVIGAVFVGVMVDALCEADCDTAGLEGAVVGGALGLGAGGLLGAGIGALIPKWRLRFP